MRGWNMAQRLCLGNESPSVVKRVLEVVSLSEWFVCYSPLPVDKSEIRHWTLNHSTSYYCRIRIVGTIEAYALMFLISLSRKGEGRKRNRDTREMQHGGQKRLWIPRRVTEMYVSFIRRTLYQKVWRSANWWWTGHQTETSQT